MATASIRVEVTGQQSLMRALRALGDKDAPFLDEALTKAGRLLENAASSRAVGSISSAVDFVGLRGTGVSKRALVQVKHPGAKPMEFGRTIYYRDFTGRQMKATGQKFRSARGQPARPFIGIKEGGHAIGATKQPIRQGIEDAIQAEWSRFDGGS